MLGEGWMLFVGTIQEGTSSGIPRWGNILRAIDRPASDSSVSGEFVQLKPGDVFKKRMEVRITSNVVQRSRHEIAAMVSLKEPCYSDADPNDVSMAWIGTVATNAVVIEVVGHSERSQ